MKTDNFRWIKFLGRLTKTLILWGMLISGIVLATRQGRADFKNPLKDSTGALTFVR